MGEVGEEAILAAIFPLLPAGAATLLGPGDDAAVVAAPDARFVVSTDVLVEDRHFRRAWSTGYDVGWRAAVQNLADVAAMGATPTSLVVSLVVPSDLPVAFVTGLARGLAAACEPVGAAVVGGDLSGAEQVVVAVTVHGDLDGRDPVTRAGARPGDVVAHAGRRGWSAAGLALATAGRASCALPAAEQDPLTAAYLRPDPPLGAGVAAALAGATSMLDVSDGLLRDAGRVARASDVRIDLDLASFAADAAALVGAARDLRSGPVRALVDEWILTGGEDHGLLATFGPDAVLPEGFRVVGTVLASDGAPRVTVNGSAPAVAGTGWDHFGGSSR
ncbi:thiamine-phosphate kinase [Sediminihabitans luteus]|uniref:Thiamine-monophosphate kinase n=1 Tax=Sediminihabitans luteus TaxID=1138585 RepID=A0A2M9CPL2_9CELL|nr:thiamine-phosphate kinase [Sediminihabitans luteus]GIJ00485.1 thiamine-monophosphate kinase [Sediminihabitans luteus]